MTYVKVGDLKNRLIEIDLTEYKDSYEMYAALEEYDYLLGEYLIYKITGKLSDDDDIPKREYKLIIPTF